jgi:hypothetical membrane protein
MASMVALPLIGIFDEHMWPTLHGISAVVFFLCFGIYAVKLGNAIYENRDKYPQEEQASIDRLKKSTHGIMLSLGAFLLSILIYHSRSPTPFFEWFVVLYFVNFFALASFDNPFYDSVHEPGQLIPSAT